MGPLGGASFGYRGEDEQDLPAPYPIRVVNALLTRKRAKEAQKSGAEGIPFNEIPLRERGADEWSRGAFNLRNTTTMYCPEMRGPFGYFYFQHTLTDNLVPIIIRYIRIYVYV